MSGMGSSEERQYRWAPVLHDKTSGTAIISLSGLAAGLLLVLVIRYFDILTFAVPVITTAGSALIARYYLFKHKVGELRVAVDALDDALADDNVTEDEFRDVYAKFSILLTR